MWDGGVASSTQKELRISTDEEGGSAYSHNDNRLLAYACLGDWLEDTLILGRRREGVIVGWERKA